MNKARRARQKANRAAKKAREYVEGRVADGTLEREPDARGVTESEHAAAMTALARLREIRKEFHKESDG